MMMYDLSIQYVVNLIWEFGWLLVIRNILKPCKKMFFLVQLQE